MTHENAVDNYIALLAENHQLRAINAQLLAALKQCVDELEQLAEMGMSDGIDMATAAIAKAEAHPISAR